MKSFRNVVKNAVDTKQMPAFQPGSMRNLALNLGLSVPISVLNLITTLNSLPSQTITRRGDIITPSGTALGGWVDMTLRSDGSYTVHFYMHDSGVPDYDFQMRAIFVTPTGLNLVAVHSGHVEGTDSWSPFHTTLQRDDDHTENSTNPFVQIHWSDISKGKFFVTKDYSATGVIGFVEDLGKAILDIGAGAVGGALGVVIALGSEAGQLFGNLGIGGAFGVIAGVVVFAFGGGLVMAVVVGVAVGAVTNALIKQRLITKAEYDLANGVFQGTLPPMDKIMLTNLSGIGGRAFTMPGADKMIYVNLGDDYDDPVNHPPTYNGSYPMPGQLLVHELTHVWQIYNASFLPGFVCEGIVNQANYNIGQNVYQYGPPGPAWSEFNLEAQGAIVDQWFGGNFGGKQNPPFLPFLTRKQMDPNDPYFGYIANNIRQGRT